MRAGTLPVGGLGHNGRRVTDLSRIEYYVEKHGGVNKRDVEFGKKIVKGLRLLENLRLDFEYYLSCMSYGQSNVDDAMFITGRLKEWAWNEKREVLFQKLLNNLKRQRRVIAYLTAIRKQYFGSYYAEGVLHLRQCKPDEIEPLLHQWKAQHTAA